MSNNEQEILLAVFNNQSENIEYTKNRSYIFLGFYSAMCGLLINERDVFARIEYLIIPILFFASIVCIRLIWINYEIIERRRNTLDIIHDKLQMPDDLKKRLKYNLNNKPPFIPDNWLNTLPLWLKTKLEKDKYIPSLSTLYIFIVMAFIIICIPLSN